MRVPLEWLSEFIDLPGDEALAERFNMGGFEDAMVEQMGPDLSAIRVGFVASCERHPNADTLSLCSVDMGEGEPLQIVCGATNIAAGQKVAVATPGVRLPDGTKIKKSKLRGVVSQGMICSSRELMLGDEHEGILVLDADVPVGASFPDVVACGERILEVGITPNRGDTACLLGLAREAHAFFGGTVRMPNCDVDEAAEAASASVRVRIDAADACHHYVARLVRGVTVGPSPDWVQRRLDASGIRSINNVVDATNLALLEFGQPLHGFDFGEIEGGTIHVRHAREGEKLQTLDGKICALDARDLVIADDSRAVALAGVMGGAATEVSERTTDVLIESAQFHPSSVRLTARRQGIHSEASYRFERGVDRGGIVRAADRAARLITELAGGEIAAGSVEARGDAPAITEAIELSVERTNRLLGLELSVADAKNLLERVGIVCGTGSGDILHCSIPSHRNDLHLPEDLIEEIARVHGYDRIPATLPIAPLLPATLPRGYEIAEQARDALVALGLTELVSFPFLRPEDLDALQLEAGDPRRQTLQVTNPIQEGESRLRTTLLPSLLRITKQNLSRQLDGARIFEVARIFLPQGDNASELPAEPLRATVVLAEGTDRHLWDGPEAPPLFFQARGIAERLLSALGYVACLRREGSVSYLHPGAEAELMVQGRTVGVVGELHPEVARQFEIEMSCAVIEIDLEALLSMNRQEHQFREVSREPSVRRDIAVLLDARQASGEVVESIRKVAGSNLISVEIFDRYQGKGVPEGRVSLAFRMVFQRADRTLTDAEVTKMMDRVVRTLTERYGAELR